MKKPSDFTGIGDLRPISVTPILSRTLEKVVVKKYLWPALDDELMKDQFAFRPSGSTTAAIIQMLHFVYLMFDSGCDYVRCLMVDYSKAFDSVNHFVLLDELATIDLPQVIFKWISDFLSGRSQSVKMGFLQSLFLDITQSIVQGSGIGPTLYIALARRLKTLSALNRLFKYADDTTLLTPQGTNCSMEDEFSHIKSWSHSKKLTINMKKRKEIIFYKNKLVKKKYNISTMDGIERIESTTLLGVIFNENLSWSPYINHILSQISQRFYLLTQLKSMSLNKSSLDQVFCALIISRIRYAVQAFSGNLLFLEIDKINAMFRKAYRWGLTTKVHHFAEIAADCDKCLVSKIIKDTSHCLHPLVPELKTNNRYELRNNNNSYLRSLIKNDQYIHSFIPRNFK